jgi:predicted ribosome quality control (RQC) complex YloA/Tae2 family protein
MAFDSLTLRSVVSELNQTIISGKVVNIVQFSPFDIVIRIASSEKLYNLLISIHPVYARIHTVSECPKIKKRWHFADFLQNHIRDGEIVSIEQIDFDRIVKIRIIPQEEIISPAPKILIGEFMGKHSNLIILDEDTNKILESMKHVDEDVSRYRQILPGLNYVTPPPSQGIDPFSVDEKTISDILTSGNDQPWKKLLKNFQGMSPLLAREIVARSADKSPEAIPKAFVDLMNYIKDGKLNPTVITGDIDDVIDVAAIELHQFEDRNDINFPTISNALEFYFQRIIERNSLIAERASIIQAVKKKHEVLQEKHDSLQQQLEIAEHAEELKLKGDLLIANLQTLKRGQKEAKLQNFYDPDGNEILIQLNEKISPSDNAQRYYEDYKKAKRSKEVLEKLIRKNRAEMGFMEQAIQETEQAADSNIIDNIRVRLAKRGIVKEKTENTRKPKEEIPQFRRFVSSDGLQIYLGKNSKENDLLLKQESSKSDMWLHAKQIEGSHVIVKNPDRRPDIPKRTLLEAAIVAANFSKAKHSTIVPVDYTWVKYVNKPKGGEPGFVMYTHEKTLFVSPSDFEKLFSASSNQEN